MIAIPVAIKKLTPEAEIPKRATPGSAAFDLKALKSHIIYPGDISMVKTGLAIAMPPGLCALILPRSGAAVKMRIRPINTPGLIDSDYRGEIIVALENISDRKVEIEAGFRVAQMLIMRTPGIDLKEVPELPDSLRGSGGFGSTGL